jgi:secreted PhoX family phosphatase
MKTTTTASMSYHDGDVDTNRSGNPHLNDLIEARYSRRQTLFGGLQAAGAAVFGGMLLSACGGEDDLEQVVSVDAGASSAITSGRSVTLAGKVTGTASSVQWTQVSGPAVTLANANTASASFVAPSVTAPTPLVFRFTSTSATGGQSQSDTTVTVSPAQLGFQAVSKSLADVVSVPTGYSVTVLYRTGDPIASNVSAYANNGSDGNFAQRAGDHHDGLTYFGLAASGNTPDPSNSTRGLLALNHENVAGTNAYMHTAGRTNTARGTIRPEGEAIKEIEAHGVSVIEIVRGANNGAWSYVQGSALNRRITPNTTMQVNGAAKGNALLRNRFSADGTQARGTINNCANGTMPWHTYLTNEENWAGYYRRDTGDAARRTALGRAKENISLARYGISENALGNQNWSSVALADISSTVFARWNATVQPTAAADGTGDFSHDPFTMGWVVEIDPFNPQSTPRKRTALGRMNHEGCQIGRTVAGVRPAFYMGDDAQNEYIYKFVSTAVWAAADATAADRLAIGDKFLDAGTLYVAKFNADGSGQWLPLVFGQNGLTSSNATYPFADQADVLINARLAADVLGATRMDRPEWTAVNPATGEMYCTLTNNSSRTPATADAPNPRAYTDPKLPQGDVVNADPPTSTQATRGNANGHVIRLRETGDTSEATSFTWDIYAFGSGADLNATNINLSGLDATNDFSSPDGLWFALPSNVSGQSTPLLWMETDDGAYTDVTNCMLLAAIPGTVGDGGTRTVNNTLTTAANSTTSGTVTTRIGKAPGTNLRRFLVGPKECEITGIHTTPDGRSLFVNIQHPGENGSAAAPSSSWPYTQTGATTGSARPRSATIVITKDDGGIVGF